MQRPFWIRRLDRPWSADGKIVFRRRDVGSGRKNAETENQRDTRQRVPIHGSRPT